MTALEFLTELYGSLETGYLYLWQLKNKLSKWYPVTDLSRMAEDATGANETVYYGVSVGRSEKPPETRLTNPETYAIPGFWVDIDLADVIAHKAANLPADLSDAMTLIHPDFPPSLIINSGFGLHMYWLFREPWVFDTDPERAQAQQLIKNLHGDIKRRAAGRGWKIDPVHDLARVLRLPGTMNYKKSNPVPVTVISQTDTRYDPSDFDILPAAEAQAINTDRESKFKRLPGDGPAQNLFNNCAFIQQFTDLTDGKTEPEWFSAITNLVRCSDGFDVIHNLAQNWLGSKYDYNKTEKKIQHALKDNNPHTCATIRSSHNFTCPTNCGVKAPCGWALDRKKTKKKSDAPAISEPTQMEKLTDLGNAERFARLFGDQLRYCFEFGRWLVWDGMRHKLDETNQVLIYAKKAIRQFYRDAADIENPDVREAVLKHAKRSESAGKIKAMVELAQAELPTTVNDLDGENWLLNVQNGVIDLKTGELLPHDHKRLITKLAPVVYDKNADCPLFKKFLSEVFPNGENIIPFMQRLAGYCLTGDTSEQKMAIAWGSGSNGKSTLLNLLMDMMGDYAEMTPTETFMAKRNEGIPNDVARLRGSRFVLASEAQEGRRLNEPLVKQVTGQDKLTARFLRQEFFSFQPNFKLVLLTNHKPVIHGDDPAMGRRLMLIPFTQKFEGAKKDKSLPEKLREEYPGILKWAVDGCLEWQHQGLNAPLEVVNATKEYQNEFDIMSNWIDECCVTGDLITAKTSDLYQNFIEYTQKNGEKAFFTQKKFSSSLQVKGFELFKGGGGIRKVRGLALLATNAEEPANPVVARVAREQEEPF